MLVERPNKLFPIVAVVAALLTTQPASAIVIENSATHGSSGNLSPATIATGFSVAGADKLVVLLTGEGNFTNTARTIQSITYAGVPMTLAIKRDNGFHDNTLSYEEALTGIFFLDNPASVAASGDIVFTSGIGNNNGRGARILALSGTAPGVGVVSASVGSASTSITSLIDGSFLVASTQANGGNVPSAQAPLIGNFSFNGSFSEGAFGHQFLGAAGLLTPTFSNASNIAQQTTLAAIFAPAVVAAVIPEPATATMGLLTFGALVLRARRTRNA